MIKRRLLKLLASVSEKAVKRSNGTTSEFGMYQPPNPTICKKSSNHSKE